MLKFIIIIYLLLNITNTFSDWIENDITKYCENLLIQDICNYNNYYWILTIDNELIRTDELNFEKLYINNNKTGSIFDLKIKDINLKKLNYSKLVSSENSMWIIDDINFNFIKITSERFERYSFKPSEAFSNLSNFAIDDKGDFWFTVNYLDNKNLYSKIFTINNNIYEYSNFRNNSRTKITSFNTNESDLYYTLNNYDSINHKYYNTLIINNQTTKSDLKIILPDINNLYKSYFSNGKYFYLLNDDSQLSIYKNDSIISCKLPFNNIGECFSFIVYSDKIVLAYDLGTYIYDLNTKNINLISPVNKDLFMIKNMKFFNNKIFATFGIKNSFKCNTIANGIGIYAFP